MSGSSSCDDQPAEESPSRPVKKTVYFIRHAQSIENQRIGSFYSVMGSISSFSFPPSTDVGASIDLVMNATEEDAPISEAGRRQCETMKTLLRNHDFLRSNEIELVVHSPLQRAKQTCQELLGCSTDQPLLDETDTSEDDNVPEEGDTPPPPTEETNFVDNQTQDPTTPRVVNLPLLIEKSLMEWVVYSTFEQRRIQFQEWLAHQPESVVCVVGHSQFFKALLGLPFKFDNCDVYRVTFEPHKTQVNEPVLMEYDGTADMVAMNPEWYDLKLLHTCHVQKPKTLRGSSEATISTLGDESLL